MYVLWTRTQDGPNGVLGASDFTLGSCGGFDRFANTWVDLCCKKESNEKNVYQIMNGLNK